MSEKTHQPVYRAAAATAHEELRQIADRLNQLRVRQEKIYTAVQALKLLVSAQEAAMPASRPAAPLYTMAGRTQQPAEKVQALA